jgi:uncharacterized protein YaiL (DUF2058 family)
MSMSLRDQLLAAGLGNKNQAKQAREDQHRNRHTQQHQQRKGQKPGAGAGPGGRPLAPVRNVDPAKLARDQALEQKKRDKAARKERAAQVRQLVEPNALPRLETDDYYNFVHDGRIARVGVDAARRAALIGGTLAIVRSHGQYLVVPAEIAARVREREPRAVVHDAARAATSGGALAEDDPYAQFKVPDDLIW